jgi:hypothetical protein
MPFEFGESPRTFGYGNLHHDTKYVDFHVQVLFSLSKWGHESVYCNTLMRHVLMSEHPRYSPLVEKSLFWKGYIGPIKTVKVLKSLAFGPASLKVKAEERRLTCVRFRP